MNIQIDGALDIVLQIGEREGLPSDYVVNVRIDFKTEKAEVISCEPKKPGISAFWKIGKRV